MKPILTSEEMARVDQAALAHVPLEQLIARAGFVSARAAVELLGGAAGRRVVALCGKGHNGDDGRVAAGLLARRGAAVRVLDVAQADEKLPDCDLVVDAAFGTGFHGRYDAPAAPAGARVLALDIASGLFADTGEIGGRVLAADLTVTMGALKPGLLLGDGPGLSGRVRVEPIGLPVGAARQHLIEDDDVAGWLTAKGRGDHKWSHAVFVLAGSPGTTGAAVLSCEGAQRAGAGMVRLGSPGAFGHIAKPVETVEVELDAQDFAARVAAELERCKALVIGPGLGTSPAIAAGVQELLQKSSRPAVIDADALSCLGPIEHAGAVLRARSGPSVLTPHDGEFARLMGAPPGADRAAAVRACAARTGAVVLLKGPTSLVADPSGALLYATAGSPALASAGTGDVLAGVIGAFLARGLEPARAAALAAHVHGRASATPYGEGLIASDLPARIAEFLHRARAFPDEGGATAGAR